MIKQNLKLFVSFLFNQFTKVLLNDCLNINESNSNAQSQWQIKNNVATGKLKNQVTIVKASDDDKRGSLSNNTGKNINYSTFTSSTGVSVVRFFFHLSRR